MYGIKESLSSTLMRSSSTTLFYIASSVTFFGLVWITLMINDSASADELADAAAKGSAVSATAGLAQTIAQDMVTASFDASSVAQNAGRESALAISTNSTAGIGGSVVSGDLAHVDRAAAGPVYVLLNDARYLASLNIVSTLDYAQDRETALLQIDRQFRTTISEMESSDLELYNEELRITKIQIDRSIGLGRLQYEADEAMKRGDGTTAQAIYDNMEEIRSGGAMAQNRLKEIKSLREQLAQPYPYLVTTKVAMDANHDALIAGVRTDSTTGQYLGTAVQRVALERGTDEAQVLRQSDLDSRPWYRDY